VNPHEAVQQALRQTHRITYAEAAEQRGSAAALAREMTASGGKYVSARSVQRYIAFEKGEGKQARQGDLEPLYETSRRRTLERIRDHGAQFYFRGSIASGKRSGRRDTTRLQGMDPDAAEAWARAALKSGTARLPMLAAAMFGGGGDYPIPFSPGVPGLTDIEEIRIVPG